MYHSRLVRSSLVLLFLMNLNSVFSLAAPNPPEDVSINLTFQSGELCNFPVHLLSVQGKGKVITLPGNRDIMTSPGLNLMLINLTDPTKQVTLNITGAFHDTVTPDGGLITTFTGRSLFFDPSVGFVFLIGQYSIGFDGNGNLVQPLTGRGQSINACTLIE